MADGNSVDIQNLEIKISSNATGAAKSISSLITKLNDLKTACKGGCGLMAIVAELNSVRGAVKSLDNSAGQKLINLAGNLLIFVPLGFFAPLLWRKLRHWWAAPGLSMGVSCLIEFLQLFLGRSVDIDDVILNTLGGLAGYILFCLLPKKWKR